MDEINMNEDIQELMAGYILDDLTDAEVKILEELLVSHPELEHELNLMRASFELLPLGLNQLSPPPGLEAKILQNFSRKTVPWLHIIVGFLCLSTLGLTIQNFRLQHQLRVTDSSLDGRVAEILQRPKTRLVGLQGEGGVNGNLMFTPGQWKEVILAMGNLPPLPPDQVYRMWLELANGDVLFCGEFKTNDSSQVFVRLLPPLTPPKGVKAAGVFVTQNDSNSPLAPKGRRVADGEI